MAAKDAVTFMLIVLVFCIVPVSLWAEEDRLTNDDIMQMLRAELPEEVVLAKIKVAGGDFDTSPEMLESLKQQGVSKSVLIAMIETLTAAVRKSEAECTPLEEGQPILVRFDAEQPKLAVELLGQMMKEGAKKGLSFESVEGSNYHLRIAVIGETSMAGAQTGAVVLTPGCKVLTAVIRSGRWSRSGAARAVGKQLAKDLAALNETGQLDICSKK